MNPKKLFPLFVTDTLAETKTFYTEKAGFKITFDMDSYLAVHYGDKDGPELAFAASESEALGRKKRGQKKRGQAPFFPNRMNREKKVPVPFFYHFLTQRRTGAKTQRENQCRRRPLCVSAPWRLCVGLFRCSGVGG